MICGLLRREVSFICRSVVKYLDRSVSRAMGCFFACFRVRDDSRLRPHIISVSDSARSKPPEVVVSRNQLSSLFLSEEREAYQNNGQVNVSLGSPQIRKELNDEAKFLKACGTLPETPIEIRKASELLRGSLPVGKDSGSSDYHSWLPNLSIKKLQLDERIDQPPTPIKLGEELERISVSSDHRPSSCISNVQNDASLLIRSSENSEARSLKPVFGVHANQTDNATTSFSPWVSDTNVQGRNKAVRFECNYDTCSSKGSSSENGNQLPKKFESPGSGDCSISKPSPRPTPLRLSDEMETPGTAFPAQVEVLANRKTRIRSQYVSSVLNPVENLSQWKVLKEDDSNAQLPGGLRDDLEHSENAMLTPGLEVKEASSVKDLKVEASLSSWLKPPSDHDNKNPNLESNIKNHRLGKTPGDRPIIGMVAAHWNDNEPSHISPKWWDGNGIPNSTNKYKEDQKVTWHATPFEERLEKALSEESVISQKKPIDGRPIVFDEHEESDTAFSQLQASTRSVVSF